MRLQINKGDRYNKLVVISESDPYKLPSGQINRAFLCVCDCGNRKVIRLLHLKRGRIKSCGKCITPNISNGCERIFRIWKGMKDRCKRNHSESHLYFEKGISVCKEWLDYKTFEFWAINNGYNDNLQIDRIDGNDIYKPSNCRWVTPVENCNNRFNTIYVNYNGKKYPLMILVREKKLLKHHQTIRQRLNNGWSVEDAFDKPFRVLRIKTNKNRSKKNN